MSADQDRAAVYKWLSKEARVQSAGAAIRSAIDWVLDGARTQRYKIDQLERSEKAYIGNRIEHELLAQWGLRKQGKLDCVIEDCEVDVKFSLGTSWMIPKEAINELCIIVSADDDQSKYRYGLFRADPEHLNRGGNRDGKRGISAAGRANIDWIVPDGDLPPNFLLHLDDDVRDQILAQPSGQSRVTELFRRVLGKPIPTSVIDTLAVQRDPSKRVRKNGGAKDALEKEGIVIYGWKYDKDELERRGLPPLPKDHWISIRK